MNPYFKIVAGLAVLTLALTTQSSAYWPGLLLLLSAAGIGDMLHGYVFSPEAVERERPQKWAAVALTVFLVGLLFHIVLLLVVGLTLLFSFLLASMARDVALLADGKTPP